MSNKTKPKFLYDEEGNKTKVILKRKDFEKLINKLEDAKDLYTLKARTQGKKKKLFSLEEVKKELLGK